MNVRVLQSIGMFAAAAGAAACESYPTDAQSPVAFCSASRPTAIIADVRDSVTLAAKADIATGTVQSGAYVDTLRLYTPGRSNMYGGMQLGTYTIVVQRTGYHTWTRSGVAVTQTGTCGGPIPVTVQALLQPLP